MAHELDRSGAPILHFYYCPHHKEGIVPLYAVECECRKPVSYTHLDVYKRQGHYNGA